MEVLLVFLFALLFLAIPICAIVALVKAVGLAEQIRQVETRLAALEQPTRSPAAVAPRPAPALLPDEPTAVEPIVEPPAAEARVDDPQVANSPFTEPHGTSTADPTAPPISLQPASPPAPAMSFEERLGTQWAVWVGGIAVALGGIFLVRYSIEQGLLGPGVRVTLGALLAAALLAAGEWLRRDEQRSDFSGIPAAHIPGVLTAAGTTVAFADVFVAYRLYDFLSPAVAFILLGAVALATLAAALLHGPALAALGLVGAFAAPALVATGKADYWALYLYLAVVTAAAFALARLRLWRWLAITAVALAVLWTFPGFTRPDALGAHVFHVVIGFALVAALIVADLLFGPDAVPGRIDEISSSSLAAYLFAAAVLVLGSRHDPVALLAFVVLIAATVAIAWRTAAAAGAVPVAALLAVLVILRWALDLDLEHLVAPSGPVAGAVPEPPRADVGWHLTLGAGIAVLFGGVGFLAQLREPSAAETGEDGGQGAAGQTVDLMWCASAVATPLAMLAALYYRIAGFEPSIPFAACGLLLATLFALATERLDRHEPHAHAAPALFATGTIAALALALTMVLEKGWLTIALSLVVPGIAWVADKRPLPTLRVLAAVVAALVMARIGWEPRIVGSNVGTTPILNWLLYGYGIPAAAFWLAGHLLRRSADDGPARTVDAGALLLSVLLVFLEIRHFVTGGDVYRASSSLTEVALQVVVGLAATIGLERLRRRTGSPVHDVGALVVAALTATAIVLGLGLTVNPLFTGEPVGGRLINLVLLGYGLPALLTAALAFVVRGNRPQSFASTAAVIAVALALAYLTLEVRTLFHGEVLNRGPAGNAEQYTYSAVWLAFGVALLAAGVWLRSQALRFASAAVVMLTVAKVFLVDMQGLTGIYQGLSFIGLGIVLLGIAILYQRLLFPRRAAV